jgi:hypothetical protein
LMLSVQFIGHRVPPAAKFSRNILPGWSGGLEPSAIGRVCPQRTVRLFGAAPGALGTDASYPSRSGTRLVSRAYPGRGFEWHSWLGQMGPEISS